MKIIDLNNDDFLKIEKNFLSSDYALNNFHFSNFLQSKSWLEFQRGVGNRAYLKGVEGANDLIGFFLFIEKRAIFGFKYLYIPRGPIFFNDNIDYSSLFKSFSELLKTEKALFIRFEPLNCNFLNFFNNSEFLIEKTKHVQPEKTSFLDLRVGEEELLKRMGQKTRYNIRLAEKKGVLCREFDISDFEKFYLLISDTAKRDGFFIHSKDYYYNLIKNNKNIKVFEAYFHDKILAIGIFSFYGSTVSYLHGASSNDFRNLMAPYALQWFAIKRAIEESYSFYDFYGVDELKWPGVTRFKNGFSGNFHNFPGTFDFFTNKINYLIYKKLRNLKSFLRSLI